MFTVRTAPKEKKKKMFFPVWKIYILLVSSVQRRSKICRRTESSFVTTSVDFKWFPFMLLFFISPLFPKPKPLTATALLLLQCLLHFKHCRLHTARLQHCPAWRTCLKWGWCADRPLAQRHLEGEAAPRPQSPWKVLALLYGRGRSIGLLGEHLEMGSTVCLGTWRPVVRRAPDVREEKIPQKKTSMFTFF